MYILNSSCISAQDTISYDFFEKEILGFDKIPLKALEPSYKGKIPMGLLRRMSKLVRMSVGQALPMLQDADNIDGIIFGSGNGSGENSEKFLNQIIEYNEGTLTPTNFVQSTSNAVAGAIALMGKVTGYNNTHVNQGLSFEACLVDALMYFEDHPKETLLIGAGEEIALSNFNIDQQRGEYKNELSSSLDLYSSNSKGTLPGEGVALFTVTGIKPSTTAVEIVDSTMTVTEKIEDIKECLDAFLERNNISPNVIDSLLLGRNGDNRRDHFYDQLFDSIWSDKPQLVFKHMCGEHYSASAFGIWIGSKFLEGKKIPSSCFYSGDGACAETVLFYNNHEGRQHGFTLLRKAK